MSQQLPEPSPRPEPPDNNAGGLFRFLNSYPNPLSPLSRFTVPSPEYPTPTSASSTTSSRRQSGSHKILPGGLKDLHFAASLSTTTPTRQYTLSTIIIVALIAFLLGSLLRSLLSPADFIYVSSDLKEAKEANAGWREIRRLLEVKYIVGGWDFQVAVVRRH
jgi:hypothetical protein